MKKYLLFFVLIPFFCFGQNIISAKTEEFSDILPTEKVYLHTNNTIFQPGETLYFKAYVAGGEQNLSLQSSVLYVEIIKPDGSVLQKNIYGINKGRVSGSFGFRENTNGGLYKLRVYTAWQKNMGLDTFEKEITIQRVISPRLLMKLEIEKEAYGSGEEVVADVSIRNLQDIAIKNLEFEYEAEIDGKAIVKNTAITDKEGSHKIRFNLPKNLSGSDGSLTVKFVYESNTESITRMIPIVLNDLDLQFLPEGGYSLAGNTHNFAFKALNKYGNPADVKGEILDDSGNKITEFESYHQGLGSVEIRMDAGKSYFAKITSPFVATELIPLPNPVNRPASLSLIRLNENEIKAMVYSTQIQKLNLIGKTIANIIYQKELQLNLGQNEFIISTRDLPMGILQFTLFKENIPMAERLIFNHQDRGLQIELETDKELYRPREMVEGKLTTKLPNGDPTSANLSISVINDKLFSYLDDKQHNINSWLLAGSELKGEIYEPEFYFNPKEEKRHQALDLLLMTQAWRFYNWETILSNDTIKIDYPLENLHIIEGRVVKYKRWKKPEAYPTTVYVINDEILYIEETDEEGNFKFQFSEPMGEATIYAECRVGEEIRIDFPKKKKDKPIEVIRKTTEEIFDDAIIKDDGDDIVKKESNSNSDSDGVNDEWEDWRDERLELSAVMLTGGIKMDPARRLSSYEVITNENTSLASIDAELNGRVSGIQIQGNSGATNQISIRGAASFRGEGEPLMVVDGVVVSEVQNLSPSSVNSITVLKGASATSLYGSRGANGVIVISTQGGQVNPQNLNITINKNTDLYYEYYYSDVLGRSGYFEEGKEFYMPKYESLITSNKDDFRQNIYWNYNLTTDENGEADFHFYNSDESTVFRIIAEGFDGVGLVGRAEHTYSVEDEIELEVKFPLYATEGDRIEMPLWIKNNSSNVLEANLSHDLPRALKLLDHKYDLFLKSGEIETFWAPMEVEHGLQGKYKFRVNLLTDTSKQSVTKDLEIFGRGFPIQFANSTIENTQLNFDAKNIIPGSESAVFKIYLNPLEPILNGLERIIRQPHGCFEQLTSSVYPNIYALKIIEESERTDENQKLEAKAKRFMKSGYRKMAAYEVRGGGFEWFGGPPASIYLTAFGLVQFKEMKDYLNVDEKMFNRNLNWLKSKIDSAGGYKQELRKYQKFDQKRYLINNAYVNYALSFVGEKDIEFQYQTSLNEVRKSKDLYRMALVAHTAYQLGKTTDFNELMEQLKFEIFGRGFDKITADGSITYSGRYSLKTEILALYADALMKENKLSNELNQVMQEIINKSNNGYFGSTQATGLALKAIYQYNKIYNASAPKGDKVYLKINDQVVLNKTMSEYLELGKKEKKNSFEIDVLKFLNPGKNEVVMEVGSSQLTFIDFSYWYRSSLPDNSSETKLNLETTLSRTNLRVGETTRLNVQVKNLTTEELPMSVAKIGIPGGLSIEPTLLKELIENEKVAYYELTDNFLVLYWRDFVSKETKSIDVVLKAEVPGDYTGVASSTYLYYTEENTHWNEGLKIIIQP